MRDTAEALERSEAALHESAERSPDEQTRRRLHALGDAVTREAKDIDRRADAIAPATSAPAEA
jgi:ABC-type transporter Mla subunit MlaD